jgi:hypothetical protein
MIIDQPNGHPSALGSHDAPDNSALGSVERRRQRNQKLKASCLRTGFLSLLKNSVKILRNSIEAVALKGHGFSRAASAAT